MLQRAASNAYSWWWASHIRTKQSKWLDNNLQDMEDKVRGMLKLIEEDADTFAKKAEMYFRRRPELINFVEESYKSYRALAERYDHLSGELQKANNTIATVFPDQVHFGMDEDDDDQSPKSTAVDLSRCQKPSLHPIPNNNDCTTTTTTTAVVIGNKDVMVVEKPKHENTHHSSDETAKEEMSAIQKEILALQTEREFVKCSYEIGLTKYWGIEKKISELQEKVCNLQDECCADVVIEDDEARALMAVSALTSCQDTLLNLHDHQKRSTEEARKESQRIENAKQKLRAIRGEDGPPQPVDDDNEDSDTDVGEYLEEVCSLDQTGLELRSAREKARKNFEMNSETSILDLADKINELVNKVIELESTLSSQTSQIQRLRLENDELQKNLLHLEERKITCDDTKDMGDKLRQAEEELRKVEDIHRCVRDESIMLRTRFNEACGTFRVLSDTLQSPEQQHTAGSSEERDGTPSEHEADHVNQQNSEPPKQNHPTGNDGVKAVVERPTDLESDVLRENINIISVDDQNQDVADHGPKDAGEKSEENPEAEDEVDGKDTSQQNHRSCINVQESRQVSSKHTPTAKVEEPRKEDEDNGMHPSEGEGNFHANNDNHGNDDCHSTPNWQQLFLNGLEDREKVLLAEYTSILRNFKEIKKKLAEAEKKNQENMFETMAQVTKLKNTIVMRDDEIRSLRQQLTFLEADRNQHAGSHMPQQSQSSSTDLTNYDEISDEPNSQERKDENEHMDGMVETKRTDEASQGMDLLLIAEPCATSETEEKFRTDIDELLEENLEFWLRFSSSFQQIQKYQMAVQEIQAEMPKLKYGRRQEGGSSCSREHSMKPEPNSSKEEGGPSSNREQPMKSELRNSKNLEGGGSPSRAKSVKPEVTKMYKQLNDLDTDLSVWIEQNALLNEELQRRFSSLCNVKEEILTASQKRGMEGKEVALSTYQASKFQGEVLNMLQENNKVADELQAGMDHVKGLQAEVQQALARLKENYEFSGSKGHNHNHFRNFSSRARIPLRSFLFISKTKKKPSLFSCVNPIMQKQHSDLTVVIPQ